MVGEGHRAQGQNANEDRHIVLVLGFRLDVKLRPTSRRYIQCRESAVSLASSKSSHIVVVVAEISYWSLDHINQARGARNHGTRSVE